MDATKTPTSSTPTDAVDLVRHLDPDAIRQRIDAIDHERDALMVLLRAARRAKPREAAPMSHDDTRARGDREAAHV